MRIIWKLDGNLVASILILWWSKKIYLQVVRAPNSARSQVKVSMCPKEKFPYGRNEFETYYSPACIENMLSCKDICGKRCKNECTPNHEACERGKLSNNLMFCPMRPSKNGNKLEYVKYKLVAEKSHKEGKQAFKKMEKTHDEISIHDFIVRFVADFPSYSKHEVEGW